MTATTLPSTEEIAELRESCDEADEEMHLRGKVCWNTDTARRLLDATERCRRAEDALDRLKEDLKLNLDTVFRQSETIGTLEAALAEIHRHTGRGDGHESPAATAACVIDAYLSMESQIAELERQLTEQEEQRAVELHDVRDELERQLTEAREAKRELGLRWLRSAQSVVNELIDPAAPAAARCTGLTARWCPVHGDCTCPQDSDLDSPDCPLHAPLSSHAEPGDW